MCVAAGGAQAQQDQVTAGEAEARFAAGEFEAAARLWGRTAGAGPSFEETALRFVDARATGALQAFLIARLDALGADDRAQARAPRVRPASRECLRRCPAVDSVDLCSIMVCGTPHPVAATHLLRPRRQRLTAWAPS